MRLDNTTKADSPAWQLLPVISAPMPFQMALDEILFRQREQSGQSAFPQIRFYFASERSITVGYSYRGAVPVNRPSCRRLTGGGLVEHGDDLICSLIASRYDHPHFGSVRLSYLKIHEAVQKAFEFFDHRLRFYRCDENLPRGGHCFQYPIATDLALHGRKIAGGAQKRSSAIMLHQESIKIPRGMDASELRRALVAAFSEKFTVTLHNKSIDPAAIAQAHALSRSGYASLSSTNDKVEIQQLSEPLICAER